MNMNKTKRISMVSIGALLTFIVMLYFNIKVFPFGDTSLEVWTSVILSLGVTYLFWAPINKYYGDF